MESAGGIFGGIPAEAQRDHQQAGWTEQLGKDAERPLPAPMSQAKPGSEGRCAGDQAAWTSVGSRAL